jgi:DNA-directed RNA polymerase subunit L
MELPRTKEELNYYIDNQVQESLHLDYKDSRAIDNSKRDEIAKDVSAFANSDGGTIIYGIKEKDQLPLEIDTGVEHAKFSREWLEEVIQSNVTPIIDGIRISQIPLNKERSAYAVKIPKSYRGPHQARNLKRYYKRHNFKSSPMEDYEIRDILNRRYSAEPLINVDVDTERFLVYLVISNNGSVPAEDVAFNFSPKMKWRWSEKEFPPLLKRGVKFFPPGRKFRLMYHTFGAILGDRNEIMSKFDVTVSYYHPQIEKPISDTFHIDLEDFLYTSSPQSEVEEIATKIQKELENLKKEIEKQNKFLENISRLSAPTGLNLSISTLRNIKRIIAGDENFEKIDALQNSHLVFQEVLGINCEMALRIWSYFHWPNKEKSLSDIEGMTDELLNRIKRHFSIENE